MMRAITIGIQKPQILSPSVPFYTRRRIDQRKECVHCTECCTFTHLREWNKSIIRTSPYVVTLEAELEDQDSLHGTPEGAIPFFF